MNEDYDCDDNFTVETGFIESHDDEEIQFARSFMATCTNCGEWVNKHNLKNGICNLCNKSENHTRIRGGSVEANENGHSLAALVHRLETL